MKKVKYGKLAVDSSKLLLKNLVLFIPPLIMVGVNAVLFFLYLLLSGIFSLIIKNPAMIYNQVVLHEELRNLIGTYPLWSILSLLLYFIFLILTSIFFGTMKYGMIKDIMINRKTSLRIGFLYAKENYFKISSVYVLSHIIIYAPAVILFVAGYIVMLKANFLILNTPWIITAIILLLIFIYILFMTIRLLWIYPVAVFEEKSTFKSLKECLHYAKTHAVHTFITWIFLGIIGLLIFVLKIPVGSLRSKVKDLIVVISLAVFILFFEGLISMWEHLFIFKAYMEGKTPEKRKIFKEDDSWKKLYK